jgi:hypothetical protein
MPVPSTMSELFAAAASNSPIDTDQVFPLNDDYLRAISSILRRKDAIGAAIASASTTDIGGSITGDIIHITGTATINAFTASTVAGITRVLVFDGALTINRSANILMDQTVKTVAGDVMAFVCEGAGVWRCIYRNTNRTIALSGTNTYTTTGAALASDGNIITVDFTNVNTSATCTLDAVPIRGLFGSSIWNAPAIGALFGTQRLKYSAAQAAWEALDCICWDGQTGSGNVTLPIGHTMTYTMAAANIATRIACIAGNAFEIKTSVLALASGSFSDGLFLQPAGFTAASGQYAWAGSSTDPLAVANSATGLSSAYIGLTGNLTDTRGLLTVGATTMRWSSDSYYRNTAPASVVFFGLQSVITISAPSTLGSIISASTGLWNGDFYITRVK